MVHRSENTTLLKINQRKQKPKDHTSLLEIASSQCLHILHGYFSLTTSLQYAISETSILLTFHTDFQNEYRNPLFTVLFWLTNHYPPYTLNQKCSTSDWVSKTANKINMYTNWKPRKSANNESSRSK